MESFFQFVSYQWYWFGLLALLLGALAMHESRKAGPQLTPQQLSMKVNNENAVVVDVRTDKEFRQGHIVDAVNLPFTQVNDRISQLEKYKEQPLILACKMGQHSSTVAKQLRAKGFEQVYRLSGGMTEWTGSQMPVVKS